MKTTIYTKPFLEVLLNGDQQKVSLALKVLVNHQEHKDFREMIGVFFGPKMRSVLLHAYANGVITLEESNMLEECFLKMGNVLVNLPRDPNSEMEALENFKCYVDWKQLEENGEVPFIPEQVCNKSVTNGSNRKYLLSLNPIAGSDKIWLPKIGQDDLYRLRENGNYVVIAHDWVSPGSYEYGAWLYTGGKIIPLQDHPSTKIVNENGEFIFELDSSSHKGLIAIEITQEPEGNEAFFVMEKRFDQENENLSIVLYFEPYVSEQLQDEIIKAIGGDKEGVVIDIQKEWTSVYADEYDQMLVQIPVQLI